MLLSTKFSRLALCAGLLAGAAIQAHAQEVKGTFTNRSGRGRRHQASKPVRRNNMDSSSHNGIRGRKCEAEVFMLFRHGP
jgi:hypothetical protein